MRKLTARLDINNKTLRIAVIDNECVELKLLWYSYLDKYFNGSWKLKEILVSYKYGTIWIYFTFEKEVVLKQPKTVMGIDINFNKLQQHSLHHN